MTRIMLTVCLLGASLVAVANDDLRISQLEQDLRALRQESRMQAQQIEELRRQLARPEQPRAPSASATLPAGGLWLDATRWQQVKVGMTELEVITLLGPPVSMRAGGEERTLFYAVEIGSSGFLSGSVALRNRVVVAVKIPVLQ